MGKRDLKQLNSPVCSSSANKQACFRTCLPMDCSFESHSPVDRMISSILSAPIYINNVRARNFFSMVLVLMLANVCTTAEAEGVTQQYDVERGVSMSFPINGAHIDADFGENKQELESMSAIISQVTADSSASIRRIVVCGYGSPDGPYAFNEKLAKKRADALVAKLKSQGGKFENNPIEVNYVAEDWEGLTTFVEEATLEQMPNREEILKLIRSNQRPDQKERVLRKRYPKDFQYLKNNVLQKLRRSEYHIEYVTNHNPNEPLDTLASSKAGSLQDNKQLAAKGNDAKEDNDQKQQADKRGIWGVFWKMLIPSLLLLGLLAAGFIGYRQFKKTGDGDDAVETPEEEFDDYSNISHTQTSHHSEDLQPRVPQPEDEPVASHKPDVASAASTAASNVASVAPVVVPVVIPPVAEDKAPETEKHEDGEAPETEKHEDTTAPETITVDNTANSSETKALTNNVEPSLLNMSEDFERFQRMDKEVTEKHLYLDGDIDRKMLMSIAGVDKNRFAVMIRQFTGTNFSGYINAKRMEYAKQLIAEHPEYTMKMVAEKCGFNSQSTFFRVFKSVYGITPIELSQTNIVNNVSADNKLDKILSKSHNGQNDNPKEQLIRFDIDD